MKAYVNLSDALVEAAPTVQDNVHEIFDKQFENVWVKPGMRVFESVLEHLDDGQITEHVEIRTEDGDELTLEEVTEILDQNNVIWQ